MRSPERARLPQLDVLRGLAILLVMGHHCAVVPQAAGSLSPFALAWYRLGWTGVDLFFVLSGYLIGGLLLDEMRATGRLSVSRFLSRRALKIWPPLLVYLAFLGATMIAGLGDESAEVRRGGVALLARYVLALQNYLGPLSARSAHTWSLAVEEHFYIALPLALAVFGASGSAPRRPGNRRLPAGSLLGELGSSVPLSDPPVSDPPAGGRAAIRRVARLWRAIPPSRHALAPLPLHHAGNGWPRADLAGSGA